VAGLWHDKEVFQPFGRLYVLTEGKGACIMVRQIRP